MNLQEQISRMKSMMGLNEVTNPYKVQWIAPDQTYINQELSELLGNPSRFTDEEFFNSQNYDTVYNIMPKTFKTVAEFIKGEDIENEQEIKDILLDKSIDDLLGEDWHERFDELKSILLNDQECVQEGYDFFGLGELKLWKGTDPETGQHIDKVEDTEYMGKLSKFMKPLEKEPVSSKTTEILKTQGEKEKEEYGGGETLFAYAKNIDDYREHAKKGTERVLPAPFVVKYFTKKFDKEYVLIGGHKRQATAMQLGVEPIKVWLIDLTK